MSEPRIPFIDDTFRSRLSGHWLLSGRDGKILAELQKILRWWIPALTATEDIAAVARALATLDDLILDGSPPRAHFRFTVYRCPRGDDGRSATVSITDQEISLNASEIVPNVNGSTDSGTLLTPDGHLMSLGLDRMGSFERERFERWWHIALETGPQEPRDQIVRGEVEFDRLEDDS